MKIKTKYIFLTTIFFLLIIFLSSGIKSFQIHEKLNNFPKVRDSIENKHKFRRDLMEKRQKFVLDSMEQRSKKVLDSLHDYYD